MWSIIVQGIGGAKSKQPQKHEIIRIHKVQLLQLSYHCRVETPYNKQ
jgi:hypothetical protein